MLTTWVEPISLPNHQPHRILPSPLPAASALVSFPLTLSIPIHINKYISYRVLLLVLQSYLPKYPVVYVISLFVDFRPSAHIHSIINLLTLALSFLILPYPGSSPTSCFPSGSFWALSGFGRCPSFHSSRPAHSNCFGAPSLFLGTKPLSTSSLTSPSITTTCCNTGLSDFLFWPRPLLGSWLQPTFTINHYTFEVKQVIDRNRIHRERSTYMLSLFGKLLNFFNLFLLLLLYLRPFSLYLSGCSLHHSFVLLHLLCIDIKNNVIIPLGSIFTYWLPIFLIRYQL